MAESREWTRVGTVDELQAAGRLLGKVDGRPVLVVWHDGTAYAIDDRCPHLGFPLHQGTVESGLVTCLWHHARFDLSSGCTLDPWADDADGYDVVIADGRGLPVTADDPRPDTGGERVGAGGGPAGGRPDRPPVRTTAPGPGGRPHAGDRQGHPGPARRPASNRPTSCGSAYGSGPASAPPVGGPASPCCRPWPTSCPIWLRPSAGLALVHGLAFVARDVAGEPPAFPAAPLRGSTAPSERLAQWYRRFVDSRSADGAERALATLLDRDDLATAEAVMLAAATDHVFLDDGHTLDFTNKAFEAVDGCRRSGGRRRAAAHAGGADGLGSTGRGDPRVAPSRRPAGPGPPGRGTPPRCRWPPVRPPAPPRRSGSSADAEAGLAPLGWTLLGDEPEAVVDAVLASLRRGATPEQTARAVAYAAALRLVRFHTQNDHGDWNEVHHAFTTANAVHQAIVRRATPELVRGVVHGALRVHLDRFLNIPAARLPGTTGRRPRPAGGLLGPPGRRRRGRRAHLRPAVGGHRPGHRGGGAGTGPAGRGRRLPLVPGLRGRRAPAGRLAERLGAPAPDPGRRWPASWPPTPRPGVSCPGWCRSPAGCGGGNPSTRVMKGSTPDRSVPLTRARDGVSPPAGSAGAGLNRRHWRPPPSRGPGRACRAG